MWVCLRADLTDHNSIKCSSFDEQFQCHSSPQLDGNIQGHIQEWNMKHIEKVSVREKLESITEPWKPGILGQVNDTHIKAAKLEGEFVWHSHDKEDELFYVVEGELFMHFRDRVVSVKSGEFIIVPHGVEHKPEALIMTSVLLIEPATTVNTGNAPDEKRTHKPQWI